MYPCRLNITNPTLPLHLCRWRLIHMLKRRNLSILPGCIATGAAICATSAANAVDAGIPGLCDEWCLSGWGGPALPTIRTKSISIPHCTRTLPSMRALMNICQSNRDTPLSTRKSRAYLRTTIHMCPAPVTARSIATLFALCALEDSDPDFWESVLCCLDGCVGLVSNSGMRGFVSWYSACVPCCVCALILPPLALVVRTYVCGGVLLLSLGLCWAGRDWCYGRSAFVYLFACALVGWFCQIHSQKAPTQPHFERASSPPPTRFTPFQPQ